MTDSDSSPDPASGSSDVPAEVRDPATLEAVLSSYPFGGAVALFDADYRYLMIRGKGWEDLGVDPRSFTGKSFAELWPPDVASVLQDMADGAFVGRTMIRRVEYEGRIYEMVAVPLDRGPMHDPEGIFFSRDVTDESGWEALQGHLLASVPTAVAAADLTGRIVYWNAEAERLLGFAAADVLGRNRYEIQDLVLSPEARLVLDRLEEGDDWEAELPAVDRDGNVRHVLFKSTSIYDQRGEKVGAMGIGEDLTDHRRMQEGIERLNRLDSLGRLAAGVAHDFANLLSVMESGLSLLGDDVSEENRSVFADMRTSVKKGSELTRQLLAVGRSDPEAEGRSDVHEVLTGIEDLLRRGLRDGVRLTVVSVEADVEVPIGAGQLEQVLVNLVANAGDAIEGDGEIHVHVASRNDGVVIRVTDTGHGIGEDVVGQIFEPFVTARGARGTGLGLATVYGLVSQVGGEVEVVHTGPDGSVFEVRLPRVGAGAGGAEEAPDA